MKFALIGLLALGTVSAFAEEQIKTVITSKTREGCMTVTTQLLFKSDAIFLRSGTNEALYKPSQLCSVVENGEYIQEISYIKN